MKVKNTLVLKTVVFFYFAASLQQNKQQVGHYEHDLW